MSDSCPVVVSAVPESVYFKNKIINMLVFLKCLKLNTNKKITECT